MSFYSPKWHSLCSSAMKRSWFSGWITSEGRLRLNKENNNLPTNYLSKNLHGTGKWLETWRKVTGYIMSSLGIYIIIIIHHWLSYQPRMSSFSGCDQRGWAQNLQSQWRIRPRCKRSRATQSLSCQWQSRKSMEIKLSGDSMENSPSFFRISISSFYIEFL